MRSEKHAAIYFDSRHGKAFKELAARVRGEGGRTTLVWSSQFRGAQSLLPEARAVIIEQGAPNAALIEDTYSKLAHDVEIWYADENGEFLNGETPDVEPESENPEDVPSTDAVVEPEGDDQTSDEEESATDGLGTPDDGAFESEGVDGAVDPGVPDSDGLED